MRIAKLLRIIFSIFCLSFASEVLAGANTQYNMPKGVTPLSQEIYQLHMTVFWICVGIGVVVFSVLIYSLIMHRKSRGVKPAEFHEHPGLEIIWAVIPFIILIIMAIPATKVLMRMQDVSHADITIKITGFQWKWRYEYLDQGISFYSNISTPQDQIRNLAVKNPNYLLEVDHPLVVPIHKKIRFLMTANDVIHSWWVPTLGVKTDAIPGFIHDSWTWIDKPGTYRGQCAELCGVNHGFMPIVVVALSQEDFAKWVKEQTSGSATAAIDRKWNKDELMVVGKKIHESTCAVCHKVDGSGMPPAFPAIKGSSFATGPIPDHIYRVLNGKPGTAMQAFGSQLTDEEIAAVVTYQRNSFGNDNTKAYGKNAGGIVQPAEVKAARIK